MHSVEKGSHVDLHQISVLQRALVGDAVADDLVHRRTARLREAPVTQRGGVCAGADDELVDHSVQLIGRNPRSYRGCGGMHGPGGARPTYGGRVIWAGTWRCEDMAAGSMAIPRSYELGMRGSSVDGGDL